MIPRIKKSIEELNTNRNKAILKNLKPIVRDIKRISLLNRSIGSRYFVIGATSGKETGNDYNDWRFKTKLENFEAMKDHFDQKYLDRFEVDYSLWQAHDEVVPTSDPENPTAAEYEAARDAMLTFMDTDIMGPAMNSAKFIAASIGIDIENILGLLGVEDWSWVDPNDPGTPPPM